MKNKMIISLMLVGILFCSGFTNQNKSNNFKKRFCNVMETQKTSMKYLNDFIKPPVLTTLDQKASVKKQRAKELKQKADIREQREKALEQRANIKRQRDDFINYKKIYYQLKNKIQNTKILLMINLFKEEYYDSQ